MIDVAGELLTIDEAAPLLRVAPAVVQDYIRRGRRGIYLEATVIGGRPYTTRDAGERFLPPLGREPDQAADQHLIGPEPQPGSAQTEQGEPAGRTGFGEDGVLMGRAMHHDAIPIV